MPTIEENGLTISYGEAGEGSALVLLHAAGSTGAQWRGVLGELDDRYHTLTPDLWGHGRTSFWPDPNTLLHDDQADLVKRILEEVGVESFDLVGHSYGGGTAIRFVLDHPEMVRSLILIEPMVACFLRELDETLSDRENSGLTKKELLNVERERDKLDRALGGIANMGGLPSLMFVIDTNKEQIAIKEAKKLGIPVVAVIDTNCDPDDVDFPFPGNDDAARSISMYCNLIADAVLDGLAESSAGLGIDLGESEDLEGLVDADVAAADDSADAGAGEETEAKAES